MSQFYVKSFPKTPAGVRTPRTLPPALEPLRRRYQSGEDVSLDDVFQAINLSDRERHVLRARLAGRSYLDIAADAAVCRPDGGAPSRQRILQIEAGVMGKLGLCESVEKAIHADERAGRAARMLGRGGLARGELCDGPEAWAAARRRSRLTSEDLAHERAVREFLARARALGRPRPAPSA